MMIEDDLATASLFQEQHSDPFLNYVTWDNFVLLLKHLNDVS